jgi:hypothetical protein
MSTINPNRYPLDLSGSLVSNLVKDENVTLPVRKTRVFQPLSAPYFKDSIKIVDTTNGRQLTNSQWKPFNLIGSATLQTGIGAEVYAFVVITDQSVSGSLKITYQTVGGDYITGYESLLNLINSQTTDDRPIAYGNILELPEGFDTNNHLHDLNNTYGWEHVINSLETLKRVILLGDDLKKDQVLKYIDTQLAASNAVVAAQVDPASAFGAHVNVPNAHGVTANTVGLGSVQNYPIATSAEAFAGVAANKYMTTDLVSAVVKNAINLGMDAHIARTDNPHALTAAQVQLGNLRNYSTASLAELKAPDAANPKYVINTSVGAYLTEFFTTQSTAIDAAFSSANTRLGTMTTKLNDMQTDITNLAKKADDASKANTDALDAIAQASTKTQTNKLDLASSLSYVDSQYQTYVTQAIEHARQDGFSKGYSAGLAAK